MATFLVVDDKPEIVDLVKDVLEQAGHKVIVALDGLAAIAAIDANRDALDIIITDHQMPGASGVKVINHVQERYPEKVIPIILMSGDLEVLLNLQPGLVVFLKKPFTAQELMDWVERLLRALELDE